MWRLKGLTAILLLFSLSVELTMGQRNQNCQVTNSNTESGKVDVHCDCMQMLTQMNLRIAQLTIDQASCKENGLEIRWRDLETRVAPETLILANSYVSFTPRISDESWNSSIKALQFVATEIVELPSNVFSGMTLLEEVRVLGSAIETIKSDAFSHLPTLKLVEFGNSTIVNIEENAFNNLPALEDLAFTFSSIRTIDTLAINLILPSITQNQRCQEIGRTIPNLEDTLQSIMGRALTSTGHIPFPEYGTRLVFLGNQITSIMTKSVNTNTFGFLIVGRNHIDNVEREAFTMELYNECELSAALFVGNTIDTLNSLALEGLRAKAGAPNKTFISVANNTFISVFEQAFRLSDNISIFAVEENRFTCDCAALGWILPGAYSQVQQELEQELVSKATCLDGSNLVSFSSSCTDHGQPTATTVPPKNTHTMAPQQGVPQGSGTAKLTVATSIVTFIICYQFL
ncbi:hypothetical protein SK128_004362 [Halocaridina rubra]|uniref:Uncharacterized protein n=1 Tax=Halocaridina rubra TaxID=373956 RepID=A0AAN8XTB5_HALRR